MPERIQLSRRKGWRKPEGAIVVARPTKWGNPIRASEYAGLLAHNPDDPEDSHIIGMAEARRLAVVDFRYERASYGYPSDDEVRAALAGADLACWCPLDGACHADVLLEIANATSPNTQEENDRG